MNSPGRSGRLRVRVISQVLLLLSAGRHSGATAGTVEARVLISKGAPVRLVTVTVLLRFSCLRIRRRNISAGCLCLEVEGIIVVGRWVRVVMKEAPWGVK